MKQNRRNFLKSSGLLAGAIITSSSMDLLSKNINYKVGNNKMKFSFKPFTLELKHVFTIATSSRSTTPVMLTQIEYNGAIGYGEASMPPYLGESQKTAAEFLKNSTR